MRAIIAPLTILPFVLMPLLVIGQAANEDSSELHRLGLKELGQYAEDHSRRLQIAQKEVQKANKDVQATTAIGLPQVQVSGNYENYIDRPVNLIPAEFFGGPQGEFAEVKFGTEHNARYQIQAEQLIFDGSYFVGLQASKAYKQVAQDRVEKSRMETKRRVSNAYVSTLSARQELKSLEKTIKNIRDLYEETDAMYQEGMMAREEKDQLERTVLNMESSIQAARKGLERAKRSLKLLAGMPVRDSLVLTDSLKGVLEKGNDAGLLGQPFHPKEHIEHQIASKQVQLKELNYKNEKVDFLPNLNAFFNYQENAQRDEFDFFEDNDGKWFPQTVAGIRVSIPIFNSGRKLFQAQKAKVERLKAEVEQEQVDQQLRTDYRNAKSRYIQYRKELSNQKEALDLSKSILERTISKHKAGTASSLEVTQTKNQYLEDRRAHIRSARELLHARTELKEILGKY